MRLWFSAAGCKTCPLIGRMFLQTECEEGQLSTAMSHTTAQRTEDVTERILTAPNVISFARLCLVPVYLWLLFQGQNVAAVIVFAVAALTDFVDGQVARRTHSVSKLGKLLDPAVDTVLMVTGVVGACAIGECPVWVAVIVFVREVFLVAGGAVLLKRFNIHVPVIYPGKVATTLLFIGFAALLLGIPLMPGLAWTDVPWLPGFNGQPACWGIWLVYAGLVLQIGVTVFYCVRAWGMLQAERASCGL